VAYEERIECWNCDTVIDVTEFSVGDEFDCPNRQGVKPLSDFFCQKHNRYRKLGRCSLPSRKFGDKGYLGAGTMSAPSIFMNRIG
jgi:hypothetical protein